MVQRVTLKAVAAVAVFMVFAFGAGAATVALEDAAASVGFSTALSLTLSLVNDPGDAVAGGQMDLVFDPGVMTLMDVTVGAAADAAGKDIVYAETEPGLVRLIFSGMNLNAVADGDLAELDFVVADGTPSGVYSVDLEGLALCDPYGAAVAGLADPSEVTLDALPLPVGNVFLAALAVLGVALCGFGAAGIAKCRLCRVKEH